MIRFIIMHKWFILISLFLIIWSLVLVFYSPEDIAGSLGIGGSYALIFFTALIGVSGFASAPFYATLTTLASTGEFNPLILGITVAPARALGDSLFFLWGYRGKHVIKNLSGSFFKKITKWFSKIPPWSAPAAAYIYTAATPLPQDVLMTAMGALGAKFWKILIAVTLGNATFVTIIVFIASKGS